MNDYYIIIKKLGSDFMNRCILCGRKINDVNHVLGLSCLKRLCLSMNIMGVKNLKDETLLNNQIRKICDKKRLPQDQTRMLTNRYLTLKLLNEVQIEEYDKYREIIQNDIDCIDKQTNIKDLKSFNKITLKQASEINKLYKKNQNIFEKINNGEYDEIQKISFDLIRFAFSIYYNKKPYLSDMNQKLQHYVLMGGATLLRLDNKIFAAECLEHCLQEHPKDIKITEGNVINDIVKDANFKKAINEFINDNQKNGQINNCIQVIEFKKGNLGLSLHNATLKVNGIKNENKKWEIDISITDLYDFTELKKLQEYIVQNADLVENFENFAAAFGNNLAVIATSCKVVNTYNIIIEFRILNWEV